MTQQVETPRTADGMVDHNAGWKLWTDMVRYYPSGVHRRRLIVDWLAPLEPRSVLDVGCGPGHLLDRIHQRLPDARLTGLDSADETIAENRERLPWGRFEAVDIGKGRLDEKFDAVICSEVLEHVLDDRTALVHLAAMTGRHLLITVPTGRLYPLEKGFGHLRHYRLEEISGDLEKLGLRVRRAEAWGFPWMTLFKRAANLRPQAVMDGFGSGRWSWPKKLVGATLSGLFHFNLPWWGPQIIILAERP